MLRINQTKKCETKDSSLRINFVLEPRDQRFTGSLSLSRSVGRVGENRGNEVDNNLVYQVIYYDSQCQRIFFKSIKTPHEKSLLSILVCIVSAISRIACWVE